jgi:hypothetical protein
MAGQNPTGTKIEKKEKICFVISPIGDEGSDIRNYADVVYEFIIKPAVEKHLYKPIRADAIAKPGVVTSDIVNHVLDDDLVVTDLTLANPNVTYELALRHIVKKPYIQIKDSFGQLPFDIQPTRTIIFRYGNAHSMLSCREQISQQIESIHSDPSKVDSPITRSVTLHALESSKDPIKEYIQQMELRLNSRMDNIEARFNFHPKVLQPGEAPPFSGQTVYIDPTKVMLDPSQSLSGVVINPTLSNAKPTVLGGPSVFVDTSSWFSDLNKRIEKKDSGDK